MPDQVTIVITRRHLQIILAALALSVLAVVLVVGRAAASTRTPATAGASSPSSCSRDWQTYQKSYTDYQATRAAGGFALEPRKPLGC